MSVNEDKWGITEVVEGSLTFDTKELVLLGAMINEWIAGYQAGIYEQLSEDAYPVFDSLMEKISVLAGEIVVPYISDDIKKAVEDILSSPQVDDVGGNFIPGV
jgi:hypothetical protein